MVMPLAIIYYLSVNVCEIPMFRIYIYFCFILFTDERQKHTHPPNGGWRASKRSKQKNKKKKERNDLETEQENIKE